MQIATYLLSTFGTVVIILVKFIIQNHVLKLKKKNCICIFNLGIDCFTLKG